MAVNELSIRVLRGISQRTPRLKLFIRCSHREILNRGGRGELPRSMRRMSAFRPRQAKMVAGLPHAKTTQPKLFRPRLSKNQTTNDQELGARHLPLDCSRGCRT
jgi:hypothetical protein